MTLVTATIRDQAGNTYSNAQIEASYLSNIPAGTGSGPPLASGSVFQTFAVSETDSFGNLTISLTDLALITPTGGSWFFNVLNSARTIGFSLNTTAVTGVTVDLTAAFAAASAPLFPAINLNTVGVVSFVEQTAPAGVAGKDVLWGDSGAHRLKVNNNNTGSTNIALASDNLGSFAATTSAQLAGVISDETGTGPLVFATGSAIAPASMNGLAIVMADQFASIQAAINALPAGGGVVDARSPNVNLTMGAIDTGSNTKIVTLLLGPFTYTFTQITVRQGFNILGAGMIDTNLQNVGTNANPAFVIPQVNNNAIIFHWSDFQVLALAGNTSQDGIFFDASTLTNAGVELGTFTNIQLTGFNGAGIHLKATLNGASGSVGAIQGLTFTNVTSIRPTGATGATQNALRIEGGCGQIEFINCWFIGTTNDTGTNVFVGTNSTQGPYSIHFHGTTNQNGNAYLFDGCTSISTENDHFEGIKGCYNIANTSQLVVGVNIKTPHINGNVGVNAGNGYIINIPNTVTNAEVTLDTPLVYSTPDKLVNNAAGNSASVKVINARTFNSATPTNVYATVGVTGTLNPAATVDLKGWNSVQVNASATSMSTFKSTLSAGEAVTLYATGGTVQFATGGNLSLGNNLSPFVVQAGDSVTFMRVDAGTPAFILVGYSQSGKVAANLTAQAANVGSTVLYAVPATGAGFYRVVGYAVVTQQATTSSTLPNIQITFTDADTNVSGGTISLTANSAGSPVNPPVGFNSDNAIGATGLSGSNIINARASTNINWLTANYASVGATPMQYAVHLKLEYFGS